MVYLPACTTGNTIFDEDLKARFAAGDLLRIVVHMAPDGKIVNTDGIVERGFAFYAAHFKDEPVRPMYLATHRTPKKAKVFVNSQLMMSNLYRNYPGIPIQTVMPPLDATAVAAI